MGFTGPGILFVREKPIKPEAFAFHPVVFSSCPSCFMVQSFIVLPTFDILIWQLS